MDSSPTLAHFGLDGVQVHAKGASAYGWNTEKRQEAKIAAIGIRVRKWVSRYRRHFAQRLHPDLSGHYAGIVPCGIENSAA